MPAGKYVIDGRANAHDTSSGPLADTFVGCTPPSVTAIEVGTLNGA